MILNYYLKMIDKFNEWFEGKWENKVQAFSFPAKYAMVQLEHRKVGKYFYCEQAYNYKLYDPYRTFVIEPFEDNGCIRIKNYDFPKNIHKGFHNLDLLENALTHKKGCDSILKYTGEKFEGGIAGCECCVDWNDKVTYMLSEVFLSSRSYHVVDRGYLLDTTEQVWGGKFGKFEFNKLTPQ